MYTQNAHGASREYQTRRTSTNMSQNRSSMPSDLGAFSGDRGGQDPMVEDLRRRHRNVFTKLPPFRPFAILTSRSFLVSFRESMSWPLSIITVSSPWCRRRCASSPLLRDRSLAFYVLKEKHNIVACADNILDFVISKCDARRNAFLNRSHWLTFFSLFF